MCVKRVRRFVADRGKRVGRAYPYGVSDTIWGGSAKGESRKLKGCERIKIASDGLSFGGRACWRILDVGTVTREVKLKGWGARLRGNGYRCCYRCRCF